MFPLSHRRIGDMSKTDVAIKIGKALLDFGIRGYTDNLNVLDNIDPDKYPTFHAGLYRALKEGKYKLVDVHGLVDLGFVDREGTVYYTMVEVIPFERRLAYTFEYEGINFALFHPVAALSLDERMAVEGVTDPDEYLRKLQELEISDVHIEGYRNEVYELFIPVVAFKNLDTLLTRYAHEVDLGPKAKDVGIMRSYRVPISSADYRNLPRTLPSPYFRYNSTLAFLNFMTVKGTLFIYALAYSWGRLQALHEFLSRFLHPSSRNAYVFYPPEEYRGEEYEPGPIFRPEGVPKPSNYTEIARFYNRLMEYELDGKPLSQIKEEDPTLYANLIRTFAYIEAQLKNLRATAFPYETIAGRYL